MNDSDILEFVTAIRSLRYPERFWITRALCAFSPLETLTRARGDLGPETWIMAAFEHENQWDNCTRVAAALSVLLNAEKLADLDISIEGIPDNKTEKFMRCLAHLVKIFGGNIGGGKVTK